jgi:hypothetical protein
MPPLNTGASPSDVDNETTAELPVLDIAAYESTLNDPIAHTDSWVSPDSSPPSAAAPASDVTAVMPGRRQLEIEPLPASELSGTHEMPAMPKTARVAPRDTPARSAVPPPAPVVLPPSPPLIEELRNALARAERRIEELGERARISDVERGVAIARVTAENAQLREQLGLHLESLLTAKERLGVQSADQPALEDELFARGDRIKALEREIAAQGRVLEQNVAALKASQQTAERLEADRMNLRATTERRNAQISILEADMLARQQRENSMTSRLTDALAATDPYVPQLRAEIVSLEEKVRLLNAEVNGLRTSLADKDQDLQVAEESLRNLEIEVRDKSGKLEEANVTVEEWRAVIAESQRSILQRDHQIQKLQGDLEKRIAAAVEAVDLTGEEVLLEGPARVFIRTDGNTDFVHVLGRRTRIGRGSDNELVLDTKHVSRYHAVLLAGPVHTSIEDLNSTNGVFVNGKRVSRQVLKDGDRVMVGKTQFRYSVRGAPSDYR